VPGGWPAQTTAPATSEAGGLSGDEIVKRISPAVAVLLEGDAAGTLRGVGSAVVVRPDGVLLTAYHLVRNARTVQVRLTSGEVYDRVELLAWDERRDVAAVRIPATGLPVLTVMPLSDAASGQQVFVVSTAGSLPWTASQGVVSALRLADEVPGAGDGYRLIQFTAPVSPGSSGGILVDMRARMLGIVVGSGRGQNLNFAVPIESVIGLADGSSVTALASGANLRLPSQRPDPPVATAPAPPPEVSERERSEMLTSRDPKKIVRAFRTIYVKRTPLPWMTKEMLEHALQTQPEFGAWDLTLVKDPRLADVTIDVVVPAFTFDYHYSMTHQNSSILLLAGKTHAVTGLDGSTAVAKNIMKDIKRAERPLPGVSEGKVEEKKI
jgi:trypsin-like peptidase